MTSITRSIRSFAHSHDDIPAFHAAYLVAVFLVSSLLNLGFFLWLIVLHMGLDFVKYRELHGYSYRKTVHAMFLESITDVAMFLVALTTAVYLHHTFLIAMVGGLVRSELTLLRALGTIIPKIHILEHIIHISVDVHSYLHESVPGLDRPMTRVQIWSIRMAWACAFLLFFAVILHRGDEIALLKILAHELVPAL
jgi:hypothetical protein